MAQLSDIIDADPLSYGRSYDHRVPVDHGERCLGYDSKTWREFRSVFHLDLQEQVYKERLWFVSERIEYCMTYSIDQTHFSSEAEVYIEQRTTCAEKTLYKLKMHP